MTDAAEVDRGARRGAWQPYALLSPGVLWLALFFLLPLVTMVRYALSTPTNRFAGTYKFNWHFSNFTSGVSDYASQFARSFQYAGIATLLCIAIGYPLAYVIAFRGGRFRNLLLGLVVVPFFTSYLIRTIAWKTVLQDQGWLLSALRSMHLGGLLEWLGVMENGHILATKWAVIGGLTYNFLPFMVLPIYVSLEKIDPKLVEAGKDLYSNAARSFRKIVLPLSLPGVFAGTLLTFIPASGDFVNSTYLGAPKNSMIGNSIQDLYLHQHYNSAAAIAFVLMAIITIGVLIYAKLLGTEELAA